MRRYEFKEIQSFGKNAAEQMSILTGESLVTCHHEIVASIAVEYFKRWHLTCDTTKVPFSTFLASNGI